MQPRRSAVWLAPALVCLLAAAGCGNVRLARQVEGRLARSDYAGALALVEKEQQQYAGPNSLLYYFNKGALLQRTGEYAASNATLEQAERLIEELYGTSVTEAAASFLVNDMTLSYHGEDFEQVMVNVLKALNYLYLGDAAGAQVEARKVNTRLTKLADQYGSQAVYRQDAFARYIAGFAHEASGSDNDAYIDYKLAWKGYQDYQAHFGLQAPAFIGPDLVRLSRRLGFDEEYSRWEEMFGRPETRPGNRSFRRTELLVVVYDGLAPVKHTVYVKAPITDPDGQPYVLKVAFPAFELRPPALDAVRVWVPDREEAAVSEVAEPLQAIAVRTLEQRLGAISAKAIARATAKYIAAFQARKALKTKDSGVNLLVGLATNIYTAATEQADTRSWNTLPNRFHLIRFELPPGEYELEVRGLRGGTAFALPPISVRLKNGEKKAVPVYHP